MLTSKFVLPLAIVVIAGLFTGNTCHAQFDIDGLRWDGNTAQTQAQGFDQGDPLRLTWGFADEGTFIFDGGVTGEVDGVSNLKARMDTIYGSQAVWQPLFQSTFDRWSSISGLDYTFEAADDGADLVRDRFTFQPNHGIVGTRADVRIGGKRIDGNNKVLAYNYLPNSGDMVIDTDDSYFLNLANNSIRLRNVVAHEHGHGIGMDHLESSDSDHLMEPFINTAFDGPQYFDILAAQRAYGDFNEKSFSQLGNDVVATATSLGAVADGATVSLGQDANTLVVDPTSEDFVSIDDSNDTDFFSFDIASDGTVDILLEALGFSFAVGPQDGIANNEPQFDTRLRSDLMLTMYDTDGVSILGMSDLTGLGGMESLTGISVNSGTYFIQVGGVDNIDTNSFDVQFYGLQTSFTATAVPEPGTIAIFAFGTIGLLLRRRK